MPISNLPRDQVGNPVQALAPDPTGVVIVSVGAVSARQALPTEADIVRISATQDCFFRFGDGSVTATGSDSFITRGAETFKVPPGVTHIAFIQLSSSGQASVTRMI